MKIFMVLLLLFCFNCKEAIDKAKTEKEIEATETDNILKALKSPVFVISTGTFFGDCVIKVLDGDNNFHTLTGNSMCSLKPGDNNFMPVLGDIRVVPQHLLDVYDRLTPHFPPGADRPGGKPSASE